MESGYAQDGLDDSGAGDVCLIKPCLLNPAAHVKGICETDQDVDDCQKKRCSRTGRETPREQGQREDGHTVRR